ncbi:acyl-CoA dehydrogenase family protein [Actinomadura sp. 9N215]|uniref:acyl-CoA dehydrogenase family protein n=1 Tax=Actinomadura sp. 9N215 TaxID=3375150 RepID=UPI0037A8CF10
MDFELSGEQRELRESIAEFARAELNDDLASREERSLFSARNWVRCAELGLTGLPVPRVYGGSEADATSIVVALEALGYGCRDNGLIFSLNAHLWACTAPLARFGSPEQRERYLPPICAGSLITAHAMSEAESGSDAFALRTVASKDGDGFRLDGSKTFVTNAPMAGLFLVFASTDRGRGFAGVSAFLVEGDAPGVHVGEPLAKMGLRTSPMAEVSFDGCPAELLGPAGAGMPIFTWAMERERAFILAGPVGTMRRNLERCLVHARERRQFGQPIGAFQSVAHRLVDMRLRQESARLLLYRLAWLIDQGRPARLESAMAKLHLAESMVASGLDAVQLHGGYGYLTEYGLERDLRDAVAGRLHSGTSEIMRDEIARLMGVGTQIGRHDDE